MMVSSDHVTRSSQYRTDSDTISFGQWIVHIAYELVGVQVHLETFTVTLTGSGEVEVSNTTGTATVEIIDDDGEF